MLWQTSGLTWANPENLTGKFTGATWSIISIKVKGWNQIHIAWREMQIGWFDWDDTRSDLRGVAYYYTHTRNAACRMWSYDYVKYTARPLEYYIPQRTVPNSTFHFIKGIVHPKMKILSLITHLHVIPNLSYLWSSSELKLRYIFDEIWELSGKRIYLFYWFIDLFSNW